MKPRELEKVIREAGWQHMPGHGEGSHRVYKHPKKPGLVIIPWHPRDLSPGAVAEALKRAGLK
ncbi:MAG: type II toxin-antitoxin system HicA family toxin [SAR324 cluster bacterium]|nr:type II toxin-antitoxin system HicA family toxin [SAR324 cluster bacterium]